MSEDHEFAALFGFVERAGPKDPQPLLRLADWCQDHDRHGWAFAMRWCAGMETRPFFRPDVKRFPWEWLRSQNQYHRLSGPQVRARAAATLPAVVFDAMDDTDRSDPIAAYSECLWAYKALTSALADLTLILAIPDLPATVTKPAEVELACCRGCGVARNKYVATCPVCKLTEAP
ncbi:unnamed protein product [Gemmataceae bacterium]|nr:unnamed protein product [Gemmataceae bacterium]VTT96550.1 unnamed protein product [Gemmataceae bacterium]